MVNRIIRKVVKLGGGRDKLLEVQLLATGLDL